MDEVLDTPAKACDAYRLELSQLRRNLETRIAEDGVLDAIPTYNITVNKPTNTDDTVTMTVSLTYQFKTKPI